MYGLIKWAIKPRNDFIVRKLKRPTTLSNTYQQWDVSVHPNYSYHMYLLYTLYSTSMPTLDVSQNYGNSDFDLHRSPNQCPNPLWASKVTRKMDWLHSFFARNKYILVLAALTQAVGWKSTAMCKISTKPNQVIMLLAVPIRCPNPQPPVVKNQSQQIFFLEIPKVHR